LRKKFDKNAAKITLIDQKDWFSVGFVKLWIMSGKRKLHDERSTRWLKELEKIDVHFHKEHITKIDSKAKTVETNSTTHHYDYLVLALGADVSPQLVPGLNLETNEIYDAYDWNQVEKLHTRINEFKGGKIAIVICAAPYKCSPAPFEMAFLLDQMLKDTNARSNTKISFYVPFPMLFPLGGKDVSNKLEENFKSRNIEVFYQTPVDGFEKNKVNFKNGTSETFDLVISVPTHSVPKVLVDSGFAKSGGYVPVQRDCRVSNVENVFAIGDCVTMPLNDKFNVGKNGVFADEQGECVARQIFAKVNNLEEEHLFMGDAQCYFESGQKTCAKLHNKCFPTANVELSDFTPECQDKKNEFETIRLKKYFGF